MDRTTLVNHYSTVEEFIAKIVVDVYEVCPHHFIAEAQANCARISLRKFTSNTTPICCIFQIFQ